LAVKGCAFWLNMIDEFAEPWRGAGEGVPRMLKLSPFHWMGVGLLFVSASLGLWSIGPESLHTDQGDLIVGLLAGCGVGIEVMALIKLRRAE